MTQPAIDPRDFEMMDPLMIDVLRQKTAAERFQMAARMWSGAHAMLSELMKTQHPDWSLVERQAEVAKRLSHGYTQARFDRRHSA